MGNQISTSSSSRGNSSSKSRRNSRAAAEDAAERAKRVVGDIQEGFKKTVKELDDDHPAAKIIDSMCGTYFDDESRYRYRHSRSGSYGSDDGSEDGSRTFQSEDDTTYDERRNESRKSDNKSVGSESYTTYSDYESEPSRRDRKNGRDPDHRKSSSNKNKNSFDTEDESKATTVLSEEPKLISKPLASSFAKRCYFTKAGIGKTTQHYEGLTLTGNVVLMLAAAMKLKGCPTICDEDLRRVEQTYPNQFSRLPDELLLSSGWRRISKYCHFSNKPIPDGVPFFHSKQRLTPSGGYYFLLAAAVGMVRPIDVEPLTKDTLVLLETDYPTQCDATPSILVRDPEQWVLVNKFCFFSGGPINAEEDVYYQADFDGNPIYMLAFLSPSLTPEELYRLSEVGPDNEPGLKSVAEVEEVESVYDLTDRDFDDLKLYHLGPCRALPQYILHPTAWTKVLPPHFLAARQQAMLRAQDFEARAFNEGCSAPEKHAITNSLDPNTHQQMTGGPDENPAYQQEYQEDPNHSRHIPATALYHESAPFHDQQNPSIADRFHHGAQDDNDFQNDGLEGHNIRVSPPGDIGGLPRLAFGRDSIENVKEDPPDDEPPSLKVSMDEFGDGGEEPYYPDPEDFMPSPGGGESSVDDQGFFSVAEEPFDTPSSQVFGGTSAPNQFSFMEGQPTSKSHPSTLRSTPEMTLQNDKSCLTGTTGQEAHQFDQQITAQQALGPAMNLMHPSDGTDEKKEAIDNPNDLHPDRPQKPPSHSGSATLKSINQEVASSSLQHSYESLSHQSPAMQGAHEILQRNRQRRLEALASKTSPTKQAQDVKSPSEASAGTYDDSGSDFTGSAISGSSVWTDTSGTCDKSSRRALILQMAKARMKNNKEREFSSHTKTTMQAPASPILEAHETLSLPSTKGPDIDLTGDLD